jgi:hypothetical protein
MASVSVPIVAHTLPQRAAKGHAPGGPPLVGSPPHPSPPLPGRLIFTHPSVDPHVALQPTPGPVDFVRALHTVSQDDWTTVVFPFFPPPPGGPSVSGVPFHPVGDVMAFWLSPIF